MKLTHNVETTEVRADAYPAVGDQLDALVALAQALEAQGFQIPEKTRKWLESCTQVKTTIPKV